MFKKLRDSLHSKEARQEITRNREENRELREKKTSRLIEDEEPHSPLPRHNGPQLAGLTAHPDFDQLLSSFVLDVNANPKIGRGGEKPVHYAVRSDNFPLLQSLLKNDTWKWDVESVANGSRGERPIHVAAEMNNLRAFKFLMDHGASPHSKQKCFHGLQPVHVAAANGAYDVLFYLLTVLVHHDGKKLLTALDRDGSTALHWAVLGQRTDCIKLLLQKGSPVDLQQTADAQCTPLHFACIERSLEITQIMADAQPTEFRKALSMQDAEGCTPLHRSMPLDYPELVQFLLDKGAPVDKLDKEGRSPMILGAIREAWSCVTVLLRWGVNPFICDPVFQRTTAHHACMVGANPTSCPELLEKMEEHPEWKERLDALDSFGYTALQYAAGYGQVESFKGHLALGADIQVYNRKYKTVLHYAAKYGQIEIIRVILDDPVGRYIINAMDHRGRSALHMASSYGHLETVEVLLHKGAFAFRDDVGRTAFHLAAARNHYHVMDSISTYFAIVLNDDDKDGSTALHLAAANDAAEAVQTLISTMMHVSVVKQAVRREDKFGLTPLDLVIKYKNQRAALAFINSKYWKTFVTQNSRVYGTVVLGLIRHLPEVMQRCLDRCVSNHLEDERGPYIKYDFSILNSCIDAKRVRNRSRWDPVPMRALRLMASLRRSELLAHPVCTTMLERKWIHYGMYCSGIIMTSNIVFVSVLSYVMVSAVERDLRPHLLNISCANVERNHPDGFTAINGSEFDAFHTEIRNGPTNQFRDTPALMTLGVALIVIFLKELAELRSEGCRYFLQWMNYMEMILFISCGGFVFCFYQDYRTQTIGGGTYQFGCIALFLAWFNLLRFFRPFGTLGIYSFMFFTILKSMVQVSGYFFLLTAAFTGVFGLLFQSKIYPDNKDFYHQNPALNPKDLRTAHESPLTSGMRIGAMTIGDLESLDNFLYPFMDGMLAFPGLSFLFYALFLVLMPILLNNLLTGLAIGDMEAIRNNAVLLRLEMQVYLHESLERLFPSRVQKKFSDNTQEYRIYIDRPLDWRTRIARWLQSGGESSRYLPSLNPEPNEEEIPPELRDEKEEQARMVQRLTKLDDTVAQQRDLLNQILAKLEGLPSPVDDDRVFASHIAEKVRRRSERTDEDRRHAQRKNIGRMPSSGSRNLSTAYEDD